MDNDELFSQKFLVEFRKTKTKTNTNELKKITLVF